MSDRVLCGKLKYRLFGYLFVVYVSLVWIASDFQFFLYGH